MRDLASRRFWAAYDGLPPSVRELADRNYELLKRDPQHPSLHLKKVGRFWSVEADGDLVWFWVGSHAEYDMLIR